MSWTDFMGKGIRLSYGLLCCTLLTISFSTSLQANRDALLATLVCDDQVNVSLNGFCEGEITVEMILEGESTIPGFHPDNYDITISGVNGPVNGVILTDVGLYTVTISENGTGPAGMNPPFNSCWGHILIEDKLPPQLVSCPCEISDPMTLSNPDCVLPILCEDLGDIGALNIAQPQAVDNCNNDFVVTFTDKVQGADCASSIVTRTWRLTDDEGNYVTCKSQYRIDPLALSSAILGPKYHVALDCGAGNSPADIYKFFADKYREDYPCALPGSGICDPLSHNYDEAHVLAYEALVHSYALMFSYPSINDVKLDGNICNTVTTYSDTTLPLCNSGPGCEGNSKVIRSWSIYDWCDPYLEPIKFSQVIAASDHTDPSIDAKNFIAQLDPWGCVSKVIFPPPTKLTDDCSTYVTYTVTGSGSNDIKVLYDPAIGYFANDVPLGEHTFYYNAFDCCDNTSSKGVIVKVLDSTAPVAITKQDIVVSLISNNGNGIEPGLTKIYAENIDNGSFDGCGPVRLEIRRVEEMCGFPRATTFDDSGHEHDDDLDDDDGRFVTFCCTDISEYGTDTDGDGINEYAQIKVWLRVWDDGDGDGYFGGDGDNYSDVWSFVRLEDKSKPKIYCPSDIIINCDSDPDDLSLTGSATANNSCGPVAVSYVDIDRDLSSCNQGVFYRRWSVDGFSHETCDQKITVSGLVGGSIHVYFPSDTIVTCVEDYDEVPTWIAGTCDLMAYSVDRDTFRFTDGACFKVLNYWTVINWCTYDKHDPDTDGLWEYVQIVKIMDDTAPSILSCDNVTFGSGVACNANGIMLVNSAEDIGLCASDKLSWTVLVDLNGNGSVDYTYSSTAPRQSNFYIPPSKSGAEIKITLPEGVAGSMTSHIVTWRVSDGCGNYTSCSNSFMVVDNIPPTPYCVNLSTALMENGQVELWACDFDLGAFDNCSDNDDLRFTFTDVRPADDPNYNDLTKCSSKTFTCDDIIAAQGSLITLNVYVWDEKDNVDFCVVFLTLVDNNDACEDVGNHPTGAIAGKIKTEFGEALENVDVIINSNQPEYPLTRATNSSGQFMFDKNVMGKSYEVNGFNNKNTLNGVSTLDLVLIQRHILGLEKFESAFKYIAADVNADESITSLDLLQLRKVILGIYEEFPENHSWKFINQSKIIDVLNPWPITDTRSINNLSSNMMQEDFAGIKIGDVNNSATVNLKGKGTVSRSSNALVLDYEDVEYTKDEIVNLTLRSNKMINLSGLQFTLKTSNLELVSIKAEGLNVKEENFGVLDNNTTTFSWHSSEMVNEFELFTISFRAIESGVLSNNVILSSEVTNSEAYLGKDFEIIPVKLFGRNNSEQTFTLFQNNPNPFNASTNVSFNLPEAGNATLSVMDITGRTVWSKTENFNKGINSFDISTKEINTTGVLYYKLESGSMSATKKMIIIK